MKVPVVVPAYHAAPYVRAAVDSVPQQPETGEVILVENGSPDNSLEVCQTIAAADANANQPGKTKGQVFTELQHHYY
jgi:glycosyltransferase involved in cell wall biosynthesis